MALGNNTVRQAIGFGPNFIPNTISSVFNYVKFWKSGKQIFTYLKPQFKIN